MKPATMLLVSRERPTFFCRTIVTVLLSVPLLYILDTILLGGIDSGVRHVTNMTSSSNFQLIPCPKIKPQQIKPQQSKPIRTTTTDQVTTTSPILFSLLTIEIMAEAPDFHAAAESFHHLGDTKARIADAPLLDGSAIILRELRAFREEVNRRLTRIETVQRAEYVTSPSPFRHSCSG